VVQKGLVKDAKKNDNHQIFVQKNLMTYQFLILKQQNVLKYRCLRQNPISAGLFTIVSLK